MELALAPGDALVGYTDGVTDARSPSGERFGDERWSPRSSRPPGFRAELVAASAMRSRRSGERRGPVDDVTIVAVGRHGP